MVAEGLEKGNAGLLELLEDLGLAERVVRLYAVSLGDDLEGAAFASVDFCGDAAGDIVAVLVGAYPLAGIIVYIIIAIIITYAVDVRRRRC